MKKTTVNMNGNTAESLLAELKDVTRAFHELEKKLAALTLHGRNYCPQGSSEAMSAFQEDVTEMRAVRKQVEDAKAYIQDCALHIIDQT